MPLISGAYYSKLESRCLANILITLTEAKIFSSKTILDDKANGILLISGRQALESSVEKITLSNDLLSIFTGRLFHKDRSYSSATEIPFEKIKRSKGKFLGNNFWGRYILISFDKDRERIQFYRDPQGLSTIFYIHVGDAIFFSSDISLLHDALEKKPVLNWVYLASYLAYAQNTTTVTPFEEILEVQPACITEISRTGQTAITEFWDPSNIQSSYINNEKQFADEIYSTFTLTVGALAREARKIAVSLSGGLDSSSILSVLPDVVPTDCQIIAYNAMHSQVASSNEVAYAQNVANRYNVPLHVTDLFLRPAFTNAKIHSRLNRPASALIEHESDQDFRKDFQMEIHDEMMGGQGGDHLFLAPAPVTSITDYFLDKGFSGIQSKISSISNQYRMPYFKTITKALHWRFEYAQGTLSYLTSPTHQIPWLTKRGKELINSNIFLPPFWEKLKNIYPGKAHHIMTIYKAGESVDRGLAVPGKSELYPFFSQPMIELALSIPTYQSFDNGYDRILFRQAIAQHKKGNFIWRTSKGETSGIFILTIRKSYEKYRELLLDGQFVQKGLVDAHLLEAGLSDIRHGKCTNLWAIANLMSVELWLKSWHE